MTRSVLCRAGLAAFLALIVAAPSQLHSSVAATSVKPTIVVTPISVIPGETVLVKGSNFAPTARVTISLPIKLTGSSTQTVQGTATTDARGAFKTSLHVPNSAAGGKYTATAKDAKGHVASASLQVALLQPSVVAVPTMAVPGTPITVNGFGFSAGGSITVTLGGQTLGKVTASSAGKFQTTFTVPTNLATDTYTLKAVENSGRQASISLRIFRQITTHFYFASLYTGPGYQEFLIFVNTTEIRAQVHITYQLTSGAPRSRTISIPAHARFTENVKSDLGSGASASAVIATDVPIAAERMMFHRSDIAIDPGATSPARAWYFTNGNTTHFYHEYIAIQNPENAQAQVTVHFYPTHSHPSALTRTMAPQSRTTVNVNRYVHDAVGLVVTASEPVVANRTEYIHNGVASKTGVTGSAHHWYFASGQRDGSPNNWNRHWAGVVNSSGSWSYLSLHAYAPSGEEFGTVTRWIRPYAREGFLMNDVAGLRNVAVAVTTSQPSIAEQLTFLNYNHAQNTDSFGVTVPQKSVQFAAASTWPGQDNLLSVFNPNLAPIPVVVQFLNSRAGRTEQTYVIPPLAHDVIDVGRVMPNAQLGLLVASNDPFVALDRQIMFNGSGADTTIGTQP